MIGLPEAAFDRPDVYIVTGEVPETEGFLRKADYMQFSVPQTAHFRIEKGNRITVCLLPGASMGAVQLYVLGSCMGACLYQRGGMLLHGSCVAKDGKGLLLMGDSGVGKSTLARRFIEMGWQLVTDDVASILVQEGVHYVQSSYPSQKLWQDAMVRHALNGSPLYRENNTEKYHVDAAAAFCPGLTRLCAVVRLAVGAESSCTPMEGIAGVEQLMQNTYRPYMILPQNRERHFQRCVTLADEVPLYLGIRKENDAGELSRLIGEVLE